MVIFDDDCRIRVEKGDCEFAWEEDFRVCLRPSRGGCRGWVDFRVGGYGSVEDVGDKGVVEGGVVGVWLCSGKGFVVGCLGGGSVGSVGEGCYVGFPRAGGEMECCGEGMEISVDGRICVYIEERDGWM